MALTDAGDAFVAAARRALHEAEVARRSVDAVRGLVTGHVTVAAILGFSVPLADLIGEFARRHVQVVVQVLPPESADGVAHLVRSGACDVGFTWWRRSPTISTAHPSTPTRVSSSCQKGIRSRDGTRSASATSGASGWSRLWRARRCARTSTPCSIATTSSPRSSPKAANNEMVLELVRAGVGATVTFASSTPAVLGRGAVALELTGQSRTRSCSSTRMPAEPDARRPSVRRARDRSVRGLISTVRFSRTDRTTLRAFPSGPGVVRSP